MVLIMQKLQKLKQKIRLLQNMIFHIQIINKKIVFKLVKQFSQDLNLTTILKTIRINRSTYYYWLKIEEKLKLKEEKQLFLLKLQNGKLKKQLEKKVGKKNDKK
ncbi:Putative transposase tra5 for insertion sequence element IS150 [Strawberry lethal yellows phytoplasma (CPA) str. NZSb11]|uniref:Putative transposase tra5 for insertion sequence element IS150 n=1 Tax=Strawberry lethal yellows phytoplasma (CPA) str. NZSb11 TaxID=980422 RepID=R4S282_PHYAS|nr:Putative transposase tra5 for insertion sequence element IS150 [Strawberry lethal yellows phytoplasma (CPA) str. NZSb11]